MNALAGSAPNSDGSFKAGGVDYWLFQVAGLSSGDCALVWYGTSNEAAGYPRMPLSPAAHSLVAGGTYKGGGVWQDGGGDDFRLQRGDGNELSPVPA